jgi:hypothetical protein
VGVSSVSISYRFWIGVCGICRVGCELEILLRLLRCICCQWFWFPCLAVSSSSFEEERLWCLCFVGASCAVVAVEELCLRVFDVEKSI